MEQTDLDSDQEILAWKARDNERAAQQIFKEAKEAAFQKGKLTGEIMAEISKVKTLMELKLPKEKIISKLKFLTDPKVVEKLEGNLEYIENHMDDAESVICDELGLCEALWEGDDYSL